MYNIIILWNNHYTHMFFNCKKYDYKLPSPSNHYFINCYPYLITYQGYGILTSNHLDLSPPLELLATYKYIYPNILPL